MPATHSCSEGRTYQIALGDQASPCATEVHRLAQADSAENQVLVSRGIAQEEAWAYAPAAGKQNFDRNRKSLVTLDGK
ncbi:MAG: hypothetical protein ACI8X5_002507 [Planctomycetota bacterium]|jgi:hypothetical protein